VKKIILFAGFAVGLAVSWGGQVKVQKAAPPLQAMKPPTITEMFFTYLKDYPHDAQTDWSGALQGVAHDEANWYFTQALEDGERGYLVKFPLSYGLTRGVPENATGYGRERAGVRCISKAGIPGNPLKSYWHFGDLDYWKGYLFVPVEWKDTDTAMIAVFRARDLAYLGHQSLVRGHNRAAWCAVHHGEEILYIAQSNEINPKRGVVKYPLRMDQLELAVRGGYPCHTFLEVPREGWPDIVTLCDECGRPLTLGQFCQGGEFNADDSLLFLNNGRAAEHTGGEGAEGITVYETRTWRRVAFSRNGAKWFDYEFHPNSPRWEEPEGLTWWDLDAHPRRAEIPGDIGGQLHVLMIDSDGNEFFFKHYRVDSLAAIREELAPFAADRAAVIRAGVSGWIVQDRTVEFGGFRSEADASQALRVFRHYRADAAGYLAGRNHPSWRYFLAGGRAPAGVAPGERELTFDPLGLRLKRGSGGWMVTDESPHLRGGSDHLDILWFPDRESSDRNGVVEQEARTAIKIIRKYGFAHKCGIGGWPDSALIYFRR